MLLHSATGDVPVDVVFLATRVPPHLDAASILKEFDHVHRPLAACTLPRNDSSTGRKRQRETRCIMTLPERKATVLLIVEDDRDMRSLLCDEFWGTGYQLREARDGDEAFLSVLQSVPDLILTDLRMPAGGDDYVSRLRTVAPHCPIVVITGFGDAALKARVLRAGANAYFDKPVRIADLKVCVQQLLDLNTREKES